MIEWEKEARATWDEMNAHADLTYKGAVTYLEFLARRLAARVLREEAARFDDELSGDWHNYDVATELERRAKELEEE